MNALLIRGLRKIYDDGTIALKGIDLDIEEGDFFALLGPNGAGKSTTIGTITSLINKTEGCIEICGVDTDDDFATAKKTIGLVPQEFNFSIFETTTQILYYQAGYYGLPSKLAYERTEKYLKKLGLWEKRHTQARQLSGGMKRRLLIARAMVHEPKLLILDEPTAGVDIEIRRTIWDFLRELNAKGTTIILTTHYLEEAENLCNNVAIIDHGRIIEHTSIKQLLRKIDTETFILDLKQPLGELPTIHDYTLRLIDQHTLEVELKTQQTLNDMFSALSQHHIEILSMKNKTNRLEELFVNLINKGKSREQHHI